MKPLVIIPARGGSKGLPGKNIKKLLGKPLIHYTIETAKALFDDAVICVTTDDIKIKVSAEKAGIKVPFLRPTELALDNSSTYDVLLHAINYYKDAGYDADTVVLLQPTSPFRTVEHLKEALSIYDESIDMVVSVKEAHSNPFILFEENNGFLKSLSEGIVTRRQDYPTLWQFNGAIYIINVSSLLERRIGEFEKVKKYSMNDESSHDIDTPFDWEIAKVIAKNNNSYNQL